MLSPGSCWRGVWLQGLGDQDCWHDVSWVLKPQPHTGSSQGIPHCHLCSLALLLRVSAMPATMPRCPAPCDCALSGEAASAPSRLPGSAGLSPGLATFRHAGYPLIHSGPPELGQCHHKHRGDRFGGQPLEAVSTGRTAISLLAVSYRPTDTGQVPLGSAGKRDAGSPPSPRFNSPKGWAMPGGSLTPGVTPGKQQT